MSASKTYPASGTATFPLPESESSPAGRDPGTTHFEGCHTDGPKHWRCALAQLATAERTIAQLREGNDFLIGENLARTEGASPLRLEFTTPESWVDLDVLIDLLGGDDISEDDLDAWRGKRVALVLLDSAAPSPAPRQFYVRLLRRCQDGFAHLTREEADLNAAPYGGEVIHVAEVPKR